MNWLNLHKDVRKLILLTSRKVKTNLLYQCEKAHHPITQKQIYTGHLSICGLGHFIQ
jgi:hypothetical protein